MVPCQRPMYRLVMQMCLQDSTEVVMSNSECLRNKRGAGRQARQVGKAGRLVGRVGGNKRAGRAEA